MINKLSRKYFTISNIKKSSGYKSFPDYIPYGEHNHDKLLNFTLLLTWCYLECLAVLYFMLWAFIPESVWIDLFIIDSFFDRLIKMTSGQLHEYANHRMQAGKSGYQQAYALPATIFFTQVVFWFFTIVTLIHKLLLKNLRIASVSRKPTQSKRLLSMLILGFVALWLLCTVQTANTRHDLWFNMTEMDHILFFSLLGTIGYCFQIITIFYISSLFNKLIVLTINEEDI